MRWWCCRRARAINTEIKNPNKEQFLFDMNQPEAERRNEIDQKAITDFQELTIVRNSYNEQGGDVSLAHSQDANLLVSDRHCGYGCDTEHRIFSWQSYSRDAIEKACRCYRLRVWRRQSSVAAWAAWSVGYSGPPRAAST
jgi:hypothetical protein